MEENKESEKSEQEPQPLTEKAPRKAVSFGQLFLTAILPVFLSGVIRALGIFMFVTPNNFAPGGINGVSVLLEYGVGWSSGWFLLMFNVPLFFIAYFFLGKREAILSTLSMLLSSGLLILFDFIKDKYAFPQYGGDGQIIHGVLGAVAGGIFLGIALAIMIRSCGTSGGTTVLASLVNKKWRHISVSALTSAFDACVVFASFFVYNRGAAFTTKLDPVLLALVSLFVTSRVCDFILQGFKAAYKFEIITDHPQEIAEEIMRSTRHGVTRVEAEGMYSHEGKSVLVCIIRKRQVALVQRIIRKYPGTFAYFTSASEVYGKFIK